MPLDPNVVAKWSAADWTRKVQMIRPSPGGAQGVLFVYLTKRRDYQPALADFVVKPVTESAANTTVAERLLRKVAGAKTLDSTPIAPGSSLGRAIIDSAAGWPTRNAKGLYASSEPPYPWTDRLNEFVGYLRNARSFLVQRAESFTELGDAYRENGGLARVLRDATLMKNLGRLYVADAVLGNGDRIDALNTGNIAFDADGNIVAIDSAALLTKFSALLRDAQAQMPQVDHMWSKPGTPGYQPPNPGLPPSNLNREGWAQGTIQGALSSPQQADYARLDQGHAPRTVATASMNLLFDPAALWQHFRSQMENAVRSNHLKVRASGGTPPLPTSPADWEAGRQPFTDGVLDGLKRVDTMLSGVSWLKTKFHFKSARAKHGSDANLSWTNFKMRRIIAQHAARGKSFDDAYAAAEQYALRKSRTVDF